MGRSVERPQDGRLLAGGGRFTDDARIEGAAHAVFVRSPHAHADIAAIDTAAARAVPGVLAVITGADLAAAGVKPLAFASLPMLRQPGGGPLAAPPRHALAIDRVRHVGQAVAVVVATAEAAARDAAEQVAVDYRPLACVVEAAAAVAPGAPLVCERAPGNVAAVYRHGDRAAVDAAFAAAAHAVRIDVHNNRVVVNAMEPRAAVAEPGADGRLTLRTGTQGAPILRLHLADALGLAKEKVRVVAGDIGGGFGMKMWLYPEDVAVAAAARCLGRPVRWRADRSESFVADTQGRDQTTGAELALDAEGRIQALRVRTLANVGSHLSFLAAVIPTIAGCKVATGPYAIPAIDLEVRCVLTNTVPVDAYRGAGRPECNYVLERLIERAARETGIDAIVLRRRNLIPRYAMPFTTAMGETYDSGDFERLLDRALVVADWDGFAARRAESERRGCLRGRGAAVYIESTGANNPTERVTIGVADGRIEVLSGTQAMGQGIETAYAQIVGGALGVPIERVDVVQGDTDRVPVGGGSGGSRSLFVGGSAVSGAATALADRARILAADALEAAPADLVLEEGRIVVAGTDRGIDLFALAARQPERRIVAEHKTTVSGMSWPNGVHVCEVEIDRETGAVRVDRFSAVDDVGVVVNPMLVHGQAHGGIAQGIGQALIERCVYDAGGQLLTGSLTDYALPRADDLCAIAVETDESAPCTTNPLGVKGAGECGAVGAPPAVVAAVLDALSGLGCEHIDMPITGEKVWKIIRDAG
jgi:carbon-monoxide dehydrogenase large subunit